jgi:hypothetical protein
VGASAGVLAHDTLVASGFKDVRPNRRLRGVGLTVSYTAIDAKGRTWYFDVVGSNSSYRGGMSKTETVWRALGRAHLLAVKEVAPLVILTPQLPRAGSEGDKALRGVGTSGFFDAIDLLSGPARTRLATYAKGRAAAPVPGFWTAQDIDRGRG